MSEIAKKAQLMGINLGKPAAPVANYIAATSVPIADNKNLVFISGQVAKDEQGGFITGKLGATLSVQEGQKAARLAGISLLAVLQAHIGNLDRVTKVVKLLGMVNSAPDFTDHPSVINWCSDMMTELFGEIGKHARSAVGVSSLPGGVPVEIEGIFEVMQEEESIKNHG